MDICFQSVSSGVGRGIVRLTGRAGAERARVVNLVALRSSSSNTRVVITVLMGHDGAALLALADDLFQDAHASSEIVRQRLEVLAGSAAAARRRAQAAGAADGLGRGAQIDRVARDALDMQHQRGSAAARRSSSPCAAGLLAGGATAAATVGLLLGQRGRRDGKLGAEARRARDGPGIVGRRRRKIDDEAAVLLIVVVLCGGVGGYRGVVIAEEVVYARVHRGAGRGIRDEGKERLKRRGRRRRRRRVLRGGRGGDVLGRGRGGNAKGD